MDDNFIQSIKSRGGFKSQSNNGGGSKSSVFGLWSSPTDNKQRHIKTKVLGVQDGQGFIIDIINNKIRLITFTSKEADELKKNGISVFKSASKGTNSDGSKKYQSYAVIEGIDSDTWDKMVKINGGVKTYNKNSTEGLEVLKRYEVVQYKAEEVKIKA